MKTKTLLFIYSILFSVLAEAQDKVINAIPLTEDSKLLISAKAETLINVSFSITTSENVDNETIGFEFPISFEINPLNQKSFHDNFLKQLKEIALYQSQSELLRTNLNSIKSDLMDEDKEKKGNAISRLEYLVKLLDKLFSEEQKSEYFESATSLKDKNDKINEVLGSDADIQKLESEMSGLVNENFFSALDDKTLQDFQDWMFKPNSIVSFTAKQRIDGLVNGLYRFFDGQLVLLFQFDTEPVAGNLYFNKLITAVRYYPKDSDELELKKKVLHYKRLIKKLVKLRKKYFYDSGIWECWKSQEDFETKFTDERRREDSISLSMEKTIRDLKNDFYNSNLKFKKLLNSTKNQFYTDALDELHAKRDYLLGLQDTILKFNKEYDVTKIVDLGDIEQYLFKVEVINKTSYWSSNQDDRVRDEWDEEIKEELENLKEEIITGINEIKSKFAIDHIESNQNKRELISMISNKQTQEIMKEYDTDPVVRNLACEISEHFRMYPEVNTRYVEYPLSFYQRFQDIIKKYESFTWQNKIRRISERISELGNDDYIFDLNDDLVEFEELSEAYKKAQKNFRITKLELDLHNELEKKEREKRVELKKIREDRTKNPRRKELINFFKAEYQRLTGLTSTSSGLILNHLRIQSNFKKISAYQYCLNKIREYEKIQEEYDMKEQEMDKISSPEINKSLEKLISEIDGNENNYPHLLNLFNAFQSKDDLRTAYLEDYLNEFEFGEKNKDSLISEFNNYQNLLLEDSARKNLIQKIITDIDKGSLWDFEAKSIDLDFNDGFLERVILNAMRKRPSVSRTRSRKIKKGDFKERFDSFLKDYPEVESNLTSTFKFTSHFPYGFSSQTDYEDIKEKKLSVIKNRKTVYVMEMQDIFPEYLQRLANNRLDFSPKNQSIKIDIGTDHSDFNNKLQLKKEVSSKLFNIKIFTDFIGFGSDPNGVAQFEFDRIIPLRTKRYPTGPRRLLRRLFGPSFNLGYLNYMRPEFRWARLNTAEDNDNLVASELSSFIGGESDPIRFVTLLDLLRYENMSVGADLNFLMLDFPNNKVRTEINAGIRFGRTRVITSEPTPIEEQSSGTPIESNAFTNTWRYYPEVLFRLRPEERYGATFSTRYMRYNTQTSNFSVVSSADKFRENFSDDPQWLWQFAIDAHYSPSATNDNRFFFRYRYSNNSSFETNGFSELQLGYVFSLRPRARD